MVRKSTYGDLPALREIYSRAREFMRENGNPTQWGCSRPHESLIIADIEAGDGYVIERDGRIVGVFALIIGEEPTYRDIDGEWLNDEPYGAVHRVASSGEARGVLAECLEYCESQAKNVRIDTHRDNAVMLHLLEKHGYKRCGIIFVDDGTPRIAFHKVIV